MAKEVMVEALDLASSSVLRKTACWLCREVLVYVPYMHELDVSTLWQHGFGHPLYKEVELKAAGKAFEVKIN